MHFVLKVKGPHPSVNCACDSFFDPYHSNNSFLLLAYASSSGPTPVDCFTRFGMIVLCKYSIISLTDNLCKFSLVYASIFKLTSLFSCKKGGRLCFPGTDQIVKLHIKQNFRYHSSTVCQFFTTVSPISCAILVASLQHCLYVFWHLLLCTCQSKDKYYGFCSCLIFLILRQNI
jgi:hypothetical protein